MKNVIQDDSVKVTMEEFIYKYPNKKCLYKKAIDMGCFVDDIDRVGLYWMLKHLLLNDSIFLLIYKYLI